MTPVRMSSTATYERPRCENTLDGIPLSTTYRDTHCTSVTIDKPWIYTQSKIAKERNNLVVQAANSIPLERVREIERETEDIAQNTITSRLTMEKTREVKIQERTQPLLTESIRDLSLKLSEEPRFPIQGTIVKEFFAGGSSDGPLPGVRSNLGDSMAARYWQINKSAAGGKMVMVKPVRHAPSGYKLHNHNQIG